MRQYTTIIFNRTTPKVSSRPKIQELSLEETEDMRKSLVSFYKNYNMFSLENLFNGKKYFVAKDKDEKILAGAQINPEQWKVLSLPGLSGKIILNVFSRLPILNRLFNKNYRFLTLEGIYYAPGHETVLEGLFESLLAKYQLHSAIAVVDPQTELYCVLKSLDLGLINKLNKEVRGDVICKFFNLSDAEKESFRMNPAYISGIDVT